MEAPKHLRVLDVPLNRERFLLSLLRQLSGTLETIVGFEEASGLISVVAQSIGRKINEDYRAALREEKLEAKQVAEALVDLERRIKGSFSIIEQDDEKIVLRNRACPFANNERGRPSLCMVTSNVFGTIAAGNLGYSKVVLEETIAQGSDACHVVIHLKPTVAAEAADGREYFGEEPGAS